MPDVKLMAHWVAGYPDMERSHAAALALAAGGADYLEIQFPFSDPSADGPVIERACQASLEAGFKTADGFRLIEDLAKRLSSPLFIMTYGSLLVARGAEDFARRAAGAGAKGLIIPDLPPDYDERLFESGRLAGLAVVPVIAPGIAETRLGLIQSLDPEYIYTALRLGITGGRTALDKNSIRHLDKAGFLGSKIIAGFGVRTREQILALTGHTHAVAVGSHFLETFDRTGGVCPENALRSAAAELNAFSQNADPSFRAF